MTGRAIWLVVMEGVTGPGKKNRTMPSMSLRPELAPGFKTG